VSKKKILVISDLQMPFQHQDALAFLKAVKKKYKPSHVVNIGDVTDSYCLTAWQKDPDFISANDEIQQMLAGVKELAKMFPKMDVLTSNHDLRLQRAAKRAGIPKHFIKDYHQWMGCPKTWVFHDELEIDGVLYTHGDEVGAGGMNASLKRAMHYGKSSVSGHLHTQANINYFANRDKLIFGMQVGCLIDRKALAFAYAKSNLKKPVLTVGIIDRGVPFLVPMLLDDNGRWIGKL
jgi:metallophosphoesterase superfamily enzyme